MKSRPYVIDEGAGSAFSVSSVSSQLHYLLDSRSARVFQLPAVAIVSRDVGAAYSMQLVLAESASSLMTELCFHLTGSAARLA